jgi:hypothetical protein
MLEGLAGHAIPAAQKRPPHAAIDAVINADFVVGEDIFPRHARHAPPRTIEPLWTSQFLPLRPQSIDPLFVCQLKRGWHQLANPKSPYKLPPLRVPGHDFQFELIK